MVAVNFGSGLEFAPGGAVARVRTAVHGRGGEAVGQLVLITVLYLGYRAGRLVTADDTGRAMVNAHGLLGFERRLGLLDERSVQALFLHREFLAVPANFYYAGAHFTVAVGVLLWLWIFRPEHYRWTRNLMVALTGAALVVHILVPLAPPRMLPDQGFVDLAARYGQSVYGDADSGGLSNQFAAMPSLHVGWALLLGVAVVAATRTSWRWLALAHPALTTLVVVGTANHYWLDIMVAVVLLAVSAAVHPFVVPAAATAWGVMGPVPTRTASSSGYSS
ncbi:phosphatase PAP2 family protein [Nocardia sp. NPDC057455]|uniref:phosphatase PAP2 family protein n=1 Tax=Nocardia sp. NPDC057455 TaxID=3346138 RepID=UPI003671317D